MKRKIKTEKQTVAMKYIQEMKFKEKKSIIVKGDRVKKKEKQKKTISKKRILVSCIKY